MAELVANCPRCDAKRMTFEVEQELHIFTKHGWQRWYEAFCICRNCRRSTTFLLSQNTESDKNVVHKLGLLGIDQSLNRFMDVEGYISLRDHAAKRPPEHLPQDIEAAYTEAATCLAVQCWNAAGAMFRACVDLATRPLLPDEGKDGGPNARIRRNLGLRLPWMFDHGLLPEGLRDLSTCIREDGNDAAHAVNLQKEDAEDLLDFTTALLERLYTEPKKLALADERRDQRRRSQ